MKKTILFLGSDASRTGAPIVLLTLLRWLKKNTDINFKIVLGCGGVLLPQYEALAPVFVFNRSCGYHGNFLVNGLRSFKQLFSSRTAYYRKLIEAIPRADIGLVYSNTVVNGAMVDFFSYLQCPVVSHVHELQYWITKAAESFAIVKKYTTCYIAGSGAVKRNLINNHSIAEDAITTVSDFLDFAQERHITVSGEKIRTRLKIPLDAFIVGGAGHEAWRKGKDIFLELAEHITNRSDKFYFVWVGDDRYDRKFRILARGLRRSKFFSRIRFVPDTPFFLDYFNIFDIFALTSRDDPFPLVCLEAAYLGKPIICFQDAGGAPEFMEQGGGISVPYLDVASMAEKIVELAHNHSQRNRLAESARTSIMRYDITKQGPLIEALINKYL